MSKSFTVAFAPGGGHGAWCWDRVGTALDGLGVSSVAVDLPCTDPNAGAQAYADTVSAALASVTGDVIVVGHSLAGLFLPLVALARPVRRLVFVAAVLPVPGLSFEDQLANEPDILSGRLAETGPRELYYNACAREDADAAIARLQPQAPRPRQEVTPLTAWPDVPSSYVLCTEDAVCNPRWSRRAVPARLGYLPNELSGADHSPFLSRPAEFARLIVDLAA